MCTRAALSHWLPTRNSGGSAGVLGRQQQQLGSSALWLKRTACLTHIACLLCCAQELRFHIDQLHGTAEDEQEFLDGSSSSTAAEQHYPGDHWPNELVSVRQRKLAALEAVLERLGLEA
jgi:hypothetical protein